MQWIYLAALVATIGCLVLLDRRFSLAFFHNWRRSAMTLAVAVWLFIVWDIFGIKLGIFLKGSSPYMLPYEIVPEFPIEEVLFLIVLTYSALLLYRFVQARIVK